MIGAMQLSLLQIFIVICNDVECMARRKKESLSITLPPEIIAYLQKKVESRDFASMAHGIEVCVLRYKEAEERGERP